MCRHDDLTTMMLGKEMPRINHPGLDAIYAFAISVGLPVLVHHNADRVGDLDDTWEYVHEVEDVLTKFPALTMVWVHAGVSRRCFEPEHHKMIDRLCRYLRRASKPSTVDCLKHPHALFLAPCLSRALCSG